MVGLASALAYLPHARRRAQPLFRLGLFREPNFGSGLLGNLLCRIGTSSVPFMLPLLMQVQLGYAAAVGADDAAGRDRGRHRETLDRAAREAVRLRGVSGREYGDRRVRDRGFALVSVRPAPLLEGALLIVFGTANSMQFAAMNGVTLKGLSHADAGSGNSLFTMMQMLAMARRVDRRRPRQPVCRLLEPMAHGFMLSFTCMGVVTLLSSVVFRRIDTAAPPASAAARPSA